MRLLNNYTPYFCESFPPELINLPCLAAMMTFEKKIGSEKKSISAIKHQIME